MDSDTFYGVSYNVVEVASSWQDSNLSDDGSKFHNYLGLEIKKIDVSMPEAKPRLGFS